jgi:hypothetical protein
MIRLRFSIAAALLTLASPVFAQPTPTPTPAPPIRRWLDLQSATVFTRYRFTSNSQDTTTADQLQYKYQLQARLNLDRQKRYTVSVGYFTGSNFIGTWNNVGVGHDTTFVGRDQYIKQLYASAAPVKGLELEYGGLYLDRGDADEWVTYDTDGYIAGERISVRRPRELYLDDITVTRAQIGPKNTPNLFDRLDGLGHPDYTQVQGRKRFSRVAGGSLAYERLSGADLLRGAATLHLPAGSPLDTIRIEGYRRFNHHARSGVGVWGERRFGPHLQLQAGFVSVDQYYGGWNADRMQSGRRLFASANIPIYGPISASIYATHAFHTPYPVSIEHRFDAVIGYDVLKALRGAGVF